MKKIFFSIALLTISSLLFACKKDDSGDSNNNNNADNAPTNTNVRIPAEWEEHEATWMQWPTDAEESLRASFGRIINVVQQYEKVHLITATEAEKQAAKSFLQQQGVIETNTEWHLTNVDNAWFRDNGPIYGVEDGVMHIQNWKFSGWDQSVPTYWEYDNEVPKFVGQITGLTVKDYTHYVFEKGNLEVNGNGVAMINWDCQKQRNPHLSQEQQAVILKNALGLSQIIWAYGHFKGDITTGHIDGTARFVGENKVVVADYTESETETDLAIEMKSLGFEVVRYPGDPNWLVGNGFLVTKGEDDGLDAQRKAILQQIFPNRDIHLIDVDNISTEGGGIHCVTNDQPVLK